MGRGLVVFWCMGRTFQSAVEVGVESLLTQSVEGMRLRINFVGLATHAPIIPHPGTTNPYTKAVQNS